MRSPPYFTTPGAFVAFPHTCPPMISKIYQYKRTDSRPLQAYYLIMEDKIQNLIHGCNVTNSDFICETQILYT